MGHWMNEMAAFFMRYGVLGLFVLSFMRRLGPPVQ
jgi:hypothetical protein